jgi:hypothetical protein
MKVFLRADWMVKVSDPLFDFDGEKVDWTYWYAWRPVIAEGKWVWLQPVGWRTVIDYGLHTEFLTQYRLWKSIVYDRMMGVEEEPAKSTVSSYGDPLPKISSYQPYQLRRLLRKLDDEQA